MDKDPKKLRIVFMGTTEFAGVILKGILDAGYNISAVYTQPDKKVGRNQKINPPIVKTIAEKAKVSVIQPERFDNDSLSRFKSLKLDLVIVAAYGKILPTSVLKLSRFGCINVHASLLPKFRGPSPIQNALLLGEKSTGITIMLMDEGVDTGDIISQEEILIGDNETYLELSQKLSPIARDLLLNTLPLWTGGKINPQRQDPQKVTLCQLIERQDGKINWTDVAESIYNRYRALTPWPGLYTFWKRNNINLRLKINKIGYIKNNLKTIRHIGEVFKIDEKIGVQTTLGIVTLEEVQLEGKNKMGLDQFINGYRDFPGSILI